MGLTMPPKKYLGAAFTAGAIGGAALAGVSGGGDGHSTPVSAHLIDAAPNPHVSPYSHSGGCPVLASDETYAINPITIIFTGHTILDGHQAVREHMQHHGDPPFQIVGEGFWPSKWETSQLFWGHLHCDNQDTQGATKSGLSFDARYHIKFKQGRDFDDREWDRDTSLGWYTLATPHHEDEIDPDPQCGEAPIPFKHHATFDDQIDPLETGYLGGFIQGRQYVLGHWLTGQTESHELLRIEDWNNNKVFQQTQWDDSLGRCWQASNIDGEVYVISANHALATGSAGFLSGTGGK